jgi:nucleoside-diphosphate-sugar epimerase
MAEKTALVVGVTGIVGGNTAQELIADGWTVYGLARNPASALKGIQPVAADLRDAGSVQAALAEVAPSHVFINTWLRQPTEDENIAVNGGMVRNLLAGLSPRKSVRHVAMVTGLKHYMGPWDAYGKKGMPDAPETPFREEQGRLSWPQFYYAQEDEMFAAAERDGFTWSVHRPHTVIGYAVGNAMNMGTTLAVYASICKETGRPFHFPGSIPQWNGLVDMTDAKLLAHHQMWAAATESAHNEDFNVVNGDVFRWKWMWKQLAGWFGLEPVSPDPDNRMTLKIQMADDPAIWADMARRHNLVEPDSRRLVSEWHTDADVGRPMETMADMAKSRKMGFTEYQATHEAFFNLFQRLRDERLIP